MGAAVDVSDAPGSLGGGDGDPSHVVRTPHTVGGGVTGDGQRSGGLPPRASSPAGPTADPRSRCLAQTRDRGAETGTGDVPSTSATTVAANATNPVTSQSLRRRPRRVSDSAGFGACHLDGQDLTNVKSTLSRVSSSSEFETEAPVSPRAASLDRGASARHRTEESTSTDTGDGYRTSQNSTFHTNNFRSRVNSFHSLLQDATAGKISLKSAAQKMSDTLEARLSQFGPGGVEIYRFAWERFNRRVVFHIVFYSSLGVALGVLAALAAWQVWCAVGKWVLRRFFFVVLALITLAMLPPSFPNAAAHALSLALVATELVLVGINLVLFALVHLAVFLNKYILPHWFHSARSTFSEITSGVEDVLGRENAKKNLLRSSVLASLEGAGGYPEYKRHAKALDAFPADQGEGGDEWKEDEDGATSAAAYDAELVRIYRDTCFDARLNQDVNKLGLALRTVLHRNFGGIDRLARTRHARVGTKKSAQAFLREVNASIKFLGEVGETAAETTTTEATNTTPEETAPSKTSQHTGTTRTDTPEDQILEEMEHALTSVRDTLRLVSETHRSLGRTALCLSGGGALAMYHFGVIKTLLEQGLLPQVISGTSGGSIVAAFISMFPEDELLSSINSTLSSKHGPGVRWFPPVWKMALHFCKHGVLMDGDEFGNTTKAYFGDTTFAEAFHISKRAVSIQVSVGSGHGFVLNHFTSPTVVVRTAVNASCALPGLMEPFELLAKDGKTGELIPFHPPGVSSFDGTITADIPSARLTELFNCNNFIVSQVNPHVNFVLHLAEEGTAGRGFPKSGEHLRFTSNAPVTVQTEAGGGGMNKKIARSGDRRAAVTKLLRVANFLTLNIKYGVQKLLEVDLLNLRMVRTLQGILVQDFRGHITVLPELKLKDYANILAHPSNEDMAHFIRGGERATWPHVEAIRTSSVFEIALTEAATQLRGRVRTLEDALRDAKEPNNSGGGNKTKAVSREDGKDAFGAFDGDVVSHAKRAVSSDDQGGFDSDGSLISAGSREERDDAHLGAGLSCAVESAAWH